MESRCHNSGLGVWQVPDHKAAEVVRVALEAGYRAIDTAAIYGNEEGVGAGLRASGLPREAVAVTTKLWNREHGYDTTIAACRASLRRLGLDYVDLYLIHWPVPSRARYVETWRALVDLKADGLVRSIGVSNFTPAHLARLVEETGVVPTVNQVEFHPGFQQAELRPSTLTGGSPPKPGARSVRALRSATRRSPGSRAGAGSRPPRWCCGGTSSWGTSSSRSR